MAPAVTLVKVCTALRAKPLAILLTQRSHRQGEGNLFMNKGSNVYLSAGIIADIQGIFCKLFLFFFDRLLGEAVIRKCVTYVFSNLIKAAAAGHNR